MVYVPNRPMSQRTLRVLRQIDKNHKRLMIQDGEIRERRIDPPPVPSPDLRAPVSISPELADFLSEIEESVA